MSAHRQIDTSVVIIGAGPVGLALAIELGTRNVPCVVLERGERTGHAPRAKTTHSRTREHLRRWGIAKDLADASPFGVDYPTNILFVTKLNGKLLHRFENALDCKPIKHDQFSEHGQWVPQYKLEQVLLRHAQTLPSVTIRFRHEFLSCDQDDQGVCVRYRDRSDDSEHTITSLYLVGADGARSRVREAIGATMEGVQELSRNYNIVFRAPGLAQMQPHGPSIMFWQINSEVPSMIGPMDVDDLWYFMPLKVADPQKLTPSQAADLIRRSTGFDLPYEVLSADDWTASKLIADSYRDRRIFLAGDSCHLHPPHGGFGMNLGVSDGVDLGWKLAAVVNGISDEKLLDSYEVERRQVHEMVVAAAESNHGVLPSDLYRTGLDEETPEGARARLEAGAVIEEKKRAEFFARGIVLGYCYRDSPIVIDDGTQIDWQVSLTYTPSATPGSIAPHRWLTDGASLYDRFGRWFTLLVMSERREAEIASFENEARAVGVPLTVVKITDAGLSNLYEADLALIRPDQHVGWRGNAYSRGLVGLVSGNLTDDTTV